MREPAGAARREFRAQLHELEARLVDAADRVTTGCADITRAFLDGDHEAATRAETACQELGRTCLEIEQDAYLLLARQSPVARDLRRIMVIVRSSGNIERSGSLLGHVAESLAWVDPTQLAGELRELVARLGAVSARIWAGAVAAWRAHDGLAAVELQRDDDEVDDLQRRLLREIYAGSCTVEEAVTLALIGRYYERVADHAVTLARGVTYIVTGDRLVDV